MPQVPGIGSFDAKERKAWLLEPTEAKIAWTTMGDVGRFTVAALLRWEGIRFVASHADVSREFERQRDTKLADTEGEWHVRYTSPEELRGIEDEVWEEDDWLKTTASLRRLWMRGVCCMRSGIMRRLGWRRQNHFKP